MAFGSVNVQKRPLRLQLGSGLLAGFRHDLYSAIDQVEAIAGEGHPFDNLRRFLKLALATVGAEVRSGSYLPPMVVPCAMLARPSSGQDPQAEWFRAPEACSPGNCAA